MKYDRYGFTPCIFRNLIYLPCPWTTPVIETFTPQTETFSELSVCLPVQMQGWSVAFVVEEELCILTESKQM